MLTPKLLAVDSYAARQWTSPMMVSIVQMLMPFFFVSAIALARCPGLVLAVALLVSDSALRCCEYAIAVAWCKKHLARLLESRNSSSPHPSPTPLQIGMGRTEAAGRLCVRDM